MVLLFIAVRMTGCSAASPHRLVYTRRISGIEILA